MNLANKMTASMQGRGLRAQLLRGGVGSIGLKVASLGLSLGMAVVLARVLGPDQFGIYTYVFALVSLLAVPAKFGLPNLVVRETARAETRQQWGLMRGLWRWANRLAAAVSVVLAVIGGVCAWLFADHFTTIQLITFGWGLAFIPLLALGSLRGAALRGLRKVVQGQLPEQIIRPALLIGFVLVFGLLTQSNVNADQAMALHVLAAGMGFAIGAWLLAKNRPQALRSEPVPVVQGKQWMVSVLPFAMLVGMHTINMQADIIMLGIFGTAHEVGLYRIASRGALLVLFGLTAIRPITAPYFAQFYANGDMKNFQNLAKMASRATFILALPFVLLFVFWGSDLIQLVFGSKYAAAYSALAILATAQLVGGLFGPIGTLLNMSGYESVSMRLSLTFAVVNVALNVIFIPIYGINGAALATGLALVGRRAATWWFVRDRLVVDGSVFGFL